MNTERVAVIGAGSWGTALSNLLAQKGIGVDLWVREEEVFNSIKTKRENSRFLPGVRIADGIRPFLEIGEVVYQKDIVVIVVPSHAFRETLQRLMPHLKEGVFIVSATKGIENQSLMTMQRVAEDVLRGRLDYGYAVITGPSFAKEVCQKLPTAVTIACGDLQAARTLQRLFYTEYFRVYINDDVIGSEIGGALKNVIAIASGASDALGFGHNARAALITRGLAEITRLGVAMGAKPLTFSGLAGLGDLVLTCTSQLSRNRTVGFKIGKGRKLSEILSEMDMVAEGVKTTESAYGLSLKMKVEMPITKEVYGILYEDNDPRDAVSRLMGRELKEEIWS